MKLGLFMMPLHSLKLGYKAMYDQDVEAALLADRLGYDEFWIGEHTAAKVEPVSNTLQFLSVLVPQTRRMKLCTGVLNLPQHHPARIAADAAMFDHMSNGRFIMGIGPGGLVSDFELYGTTEKNRQAMMVEAIDMIEAIWRSDPPYELSGEHWTITVRDSYQPDMGIGPMPKPLQDPFPTFCTSAMSPHSGTARLAGERGWELISANFNAAWSVRSHWASYCQGAEAGGRRPDPATWRVARSILVTDSARRAEDYLARPGNAIEGYYTYLFTQLGRAGARKIFLLAEDMAEDDLTLPAVLDSMVIAGSPDQVTDKLVAFIDEVGPFGGLLAAFHEWDDKAIWQGSMRHLVETVMPKVADYGRSKLAA
ncbi:LLM class flavin-dependent oxidoreductase [Marinivivus vitaminiproducens]|uniref:LLM class flavin-dependent oxidoreductase n=1 Tax=Marinivivus vitaminiproducens TaxID=3035935 RepID=UPI0027A84B05|nr:LLM class flavin-dependent oxidoreductase [Geminicoccaceae bacterium SCSIO 64248]